MNELRPVGATFETEGLFGYTTDGTPYATERGWLVQRYEVVAHTMTADSLEPNAPTRLTEEVRCVASTLYPVTAVRVVAVPVAVREDGSPLTVKRFLPAIGNEPRSL